MMLMPARGRQEESQIFFMHDTSDRPLARAEGGREGRARQVQAPAHALRQVHGGEGLPIYRDVGCAAFRTCRWSVEAHRRQGHLSSSTAPRAFGASMSSRCRAPARSMSRGTFTRSSARRRRPRHHRSLAGRAASIRSSSGSAAPCSRFPSMPTSHRQRDGPGLAARRHDGAERDEPLDNDDFIFNCPFPFKDRFYGNRIFSSRATMSSRPDSRPRHAPHQSASRRDQLRSAARQSPLARLSPHRAGDGEQPFLSLDRPARDRPLCQGA